MANIADDIADYLAGQGIGTVGTDIFVGRVFGDPDNMVVVLATGGPQPNVNIAGLKEYTFQVFIRNTSYSAGNTKLEAVRTALQVKINLSLANHRALNILAQSEGGHIGQDEEGRDEFSINFRCRAHVQ